MNIVITGSTLGIGRALAYKFLKEGDKVVITSRNQKRVDATVQEFSKEFSSENVFGTTCDVADENQVDSLVNFSVDQLGIINIWINNAGTNGFDWNHLIDMQPSSIRSVVETNLLGTILCCRAILKVMLKQNLGHVFNFQGFGSNGNVRPRMLCYASTKRAIPTVTKSLVVETQGSNVGIHDISPGMVLTDLLLKGRDEQTLGFVKQYAQKPEVVADSLVPQIRNVEGTGKIVRFVRPEDK